MKKIVLFLISVLFFRALYEQESPQADTLGVKVYFRKGYSILDTKTGLLLLIFMSII